MRNKTILLLCSALLSGSLSLSLLGCGGCASTQPRSGAASPSFQGIEILPEEKELSPAAKDTYAYLLYMQALADEDEELLLQAAQQMTGGTLPAKAWLEGALWLDSRRSEKVLPLLELGLQVWPDDLPLNLFSAEALAAHDKTEQGLEQIRVFVARHPDSLDARMELILLLVKAKRFDEAEKHIGSIAAGERTPMVDYYHARALIGMQRRAEAIPLLQKAIQAMPDFVEALVELAYAYEQQKQWSEARTIYEKLLKLQVSEQDVCLRLVHLSLRLNQPEKALKYFRKGPDAAAFKLTAISMFLESRHYLQAERLLKEMLDEPGVPPDVFLMLAGIARDQRRDTELALSWLARIPAGSPTAVQAEGLKAQILADAGKEKEALASVRNLQQRHARNETLLLLEVRLLARLKDMDEALARARQAVEIVPESSELAFTLGSLLDSLGKRDEAMKVMQGIIASHPEHYQALNYVGYSLAVQGKDLEHALELLQRADRLAPDQFFIVDSLAWALFRLGRTEEALQNIRRAVALVPSPEVEILEHYGDIAAAAGQKEEARKAYEQALKLKPANAESLRQRLGDL
ncbi:tetratricopeptide repeat protein [Desulfovibrio sp.]|uniref:tetratricopeptide repeat protein n=1 Tax=Desulfovibrio sp. TaxID=885 RepID=UPI002A90ADE7|nr:tetratricopeptide repeat protein [Desulfovibrio sp.]MDY5430107.1 tetratricopeptide repeat protein [Desulfovibrio sp.]